MNSSSHNSNMIADEHAAVWAARLDGSDLTAKERAELKHWLGQDETHRSLLSSYCQLSAKLEQQLPELFVKEDVLLREISASGHGKTARIWYVGTSFAAAAAIALVLWFSAAGPAEKNYATPIGQRQSVTLADGTRVELDAQSSLQVESSRTERRVRLASGQAFFVVSKDKTRPFVVETPAGAIRVTGTTFDVRSETAQELEVIVVEGSVQVHPAESNGHAATPASLHAGDRLSRTDQGVSVQALSKNALDDALAWREGRIVFEGVPLEKALARFAHYHGRGLSASPGAARLNIGGSFSLDDLDGFFAALEYSFPVRVTRGLSGTIEVRLRNEP